MGTRLKKYSASQISELLNSQSDSDTTDELAKPTQFRRRGKLARQSNVEDIDDETSDTENIYDSVKTALLRKAVLHNEKVSLKIRLRRSTEQSMYKIDTDSECERPVRKPRKTVARQPRRSSADVASDVSRSSDKSSSVRKRTQAATPSSPTQDENEVPQRSGRERRPPLRLSYYHCSTLPSLKNSQNTPILRNRTSINYNEDILYIRDSAANLEMERHAIGLSRSVGKDYGKDYASDTSAGTRSSGSNQRNASMRTVKRNRTLSARENGNDSDAVSKLTKVKTSRKSSVTTVNKNNNVDSPITKTERVLLRKEETPISSPINGTPVKTGSRQRNSVSERKTRQERRKTNASESEEESLADVYKRRILTPQKRNELNVRVAEIHPSTPKARSLKCSALTPSIGKRSNALMKPCTPLQEARSRLHVSAVPKSLPCREEEFNNIFTFMKGKLLDKSGGCIYISGVPGTGKTATVNEVVRCLQKLIAKGELDSFDYVTINGMKLTEPRQAYVQILKQLTGRTVTWEQAYRTLEKRFHGSTSRMTLLLVDELDFLCTKRQDVVYNLLDWPTKASAQLVVITIANTMDLPERVLMGRVTSRLGLTRLTFQPYNYKQLQEIVTARLKDFSSFRSEAIQLVARKVSAVSGDARRALDICRRAMEIAESRNGETISLKDVSEAVSEMIATAKIQAIIHCSEMEKIFLQAVSAEVTRTAVEEVHFRSAYRQLESLCSFNGIKIPTVSETLGICSRLGASRLLICEHSRNDIYQKILLNVSTDDIHYALQQSETD